MTASDRTQMVRDKLRKADHLDDWERIELSDALTDADSLTEAHGALPESVVNHMRRQTHLTVMLALRRDGHTPQEIAAIAMEAHREVCPIAFLEKVRGWAAVLLGGVLLGLLIVASLIGMALEKLA